MYKRNCPCCNKEILYKGKQAYNNAIVYNKNCMSCAKAGNKISIKHLPEKWVRRCEKCGIDRKYKSYRSWHGARNSNKCNSCAQKEVGGYPHTEKHKEYMRKKMQGRVITWNDKIANSHWSKNKELRKKIIENHSNHMSELVSSGKLLPSKNRGFKYGKYVKSNGEVEYYRSSYEFERMLELDNDKNVANWTVRHGIKIPYVFCGISKNYLPDFKIEYIDGSVVIEEVKGYIKDIDQHNEKVKVANVWANSNGYTYTVNFMKK